MRRIAPLALLASSLFLTTAATVSAKTNVAAVYAPGASDRVRVGDFLHVAWSDIVSPSGVLLDYQKAGSDTTWWNLSAPGIPTAQGQYNNWQILNFPGPMRVRLTAAVGDTISYYHSGTFTVVQLDLTAPGFLAKWKAGSTRNITWTYSNNAIPFVKLEYSLDTGTTWTLIQDSVPISPASYAWTVPKASTQFAKIRISEVNTNSVRHTGNAFTIAGLALTSPNGGENWGKDNPARHITWTATEDVNTVNLQYSLNNGSTWTNITPNFGTSASTSIYNWNIGAVATSTQARVRIQDNAYPEDVFDESDATFTISTTVGIHPNESASRFGFASTDPSRVRFTLPVAESGVRLDVIDAKGHVVATLVNGPLAAGAHAVSLDAAKIPAGVYTYRLKAGSKEIVRRMPAIQ